MQDGSLRGPFFFALSRSRLMERVAVFVDAGYLFAQSSTLLAGRKLPRSAVTLHYEKAIEALTRFAERVSGAKVLRVYWYDGTSTGPTSQHLALAHLAGVKVRLGFVNSVGEQKGVDSLIVTDMITLARNRAMTEAVLLSGDEDLRVGVQQAQEFGVRVHLLGIKPSRGSQSLFLLQEADSTHEWDASDLAAFIQCRAETASMSAVGGDGVGRPLAAAVLAEPSAVSDPVLAVATEVANEVPTEELVSLIASYRATRQIPRPQDGRLLGKSRTATGAELDSNQKNTVRRAFIAACETRLAGVAVEKVLRPEANARSSAPEPTKGVPSED